MYCCPAQSRVSSVWSFWDPTTVAGWLGLLGQRFGLPLAQSGLPGGGCALFLASSSSCWRSLSIFFFRSHSASHLSGLGLQSWLLQGGSQFSCSHRRQPSPATAKQRAQGRQDKVDYYRYKADSARAPCGGSINRSPRPSRPSRASSRWSGTGSSSSPAATSPSTETSRPKRVPWLG